MSFGSLEFWRLLFLKTKYNIYKQIYVGWAMCLFNEKPKHPFFTIGSRRIRHGQKLETGISWSFLGIIFSIRWQKRVLLGLISVTLSLVLTRWARSSVFFHSLQMHWIVFFARFFASLWHASKFLSKSMFVIAFGSHLTQWWHSKLSYERFISWVLHVTDLLQKNH